MSGELVVITMFLSAFGMVFGIRYLINKEKMAMIERGIDPGVAKPKLRAPMPYLSLKFGLLLVGLGVGLLVALFTVRGVFVNGIPHNEEGQAAAIYFGCLGIFGGLGLILSFLIEKKAIDKP